MLRKKYQNINDYWMQTGVKKTFLSVRPWQWILFCLFLLICYGAKLFYYNFGIDNESFAFRYGPAMKEFIQSGRFSIYLVKKVLHIFPFVPIFSLFLWILAFACYSFLGGVYTISLSKEKRSGLYFLIFAAVLVSHPCFAEQFYFTHQSFEITLGMISALFAATLARYWMSRPKEIWFLILAVLAAAFSFGFYQAIVPLYLCFILCGAFGILTDPVNKEDRTRIFSLILKLFLLAVAPLIVYFLVDKLGHLVIHAENSYVGSMFWWDLSAPGETIRLIGENIRQVVKAELPFYTLYYPVISCIFVLLSIIGAVRGKNVSSWMKLLFAVLIVISPFFLLIVTGHPVIIRTQFVLPFVCAFATVMSLDIAAGLFRERGRKVFSVIFIMIAAVIFFQQSQTLNRFWYTAEVTYQNDLLFANSLIGKIEEETGDSMVSTEKKILFVGKYSPHLTDNTVRGDVIGKSFFEYDNTLENIGSTYRIVGFYENIGYELWSASPEQAALGQEIAENMPVYPEDGFIQVHDDLIIVKLSEPSDSQ
ncbi:MAG: glucosyltransferase domain-containing protein [Lachnospiraceae bacterium]|nr:glucosyltransferase domain-containing protein [Lachnospiraceae bacterium]